MRSRVKGSLMLGALMVISIAATAAFAMAGRGVVTLSLEQQAVNAQTAENRAESVVNQAITQLMAYRQTGQPLGAFTTRIATADASLTFDATAPIYCTNNLQQVDGVVGWGGRKVPGHAIHLVATATCQAMTRTVEALLYQPMFPYTLLANGAVQTRGTLVLGSVKGVTDSLSGHLRPGVLVSNTSIDLGSGASITGDVQAVGQVTVEPGAQVQGHVTYDAAPAPPLSMDLTSLDPQTRSGVQTLPDTMTDPNLTDFCRHQGSLQVNGNLNLQSAVVYVDGNLSIQGGVRGTGAVIATGSITIGGASDLSSTDHLAVLCDGDLTLQGQGMESSAFKGFIYTQGSLSAADVTVLGSVVSNGGVGTTVHLKTVRLVHADDDTALTLYLTTWYSGAAGMESALPFPNVFNHLWFEGRGATYDLRMDYQVNAAQPMQHLTFATASDFFAWEQGMIQPGWLAAVIAMCRQNPQLSDVDTTGLSDFDALQKYQMKQLSNAVFGPGGYQDVNANQGNPSIGHNAGADGASSGVTFDLNQLLSPADTFRVLLWHPVQ